MEEQINKIAIVSLNDQLAQDVARSLSDMLGMTYCSTKDLLEYELTNPILLEQLTSEEYLLQSEQRVFEHMSTFCDVIISLSFDNFQRGWKTLKKDCVLVFLRVKQTDVPDKLNRIMFPARTSQLLRESDVQISVRLEDIPKICDKIIAKLSKKL